MKKVVKYLIIPLLLWTILIGCIINNDKKSQARLYNNIDLKDIIYRNKYDDFYLILDQENLYLFNNNYEEIVQISQDKLCKTHDNYQIIYRNEDFQYLKDYYQDNKLVYEYYNIYNCDLIEKIILGGL